MVPDGGRIIKQTMYEVKHLDASKEWVERKYLKESMDKNEKLRVEIENLQLKYDRLKKLHDDELKNNQHVHLDTLKEMEGKIHELVQDKENVKRSGLASFHEAEHLKKRIEAKEDILAGMQAANGKLGNDILRLEEAISKLQEEKSILEYRLSAETSQVSNLIKDLNTKEEKLVEMSKENTRLKHDLQSASSAISKLEQADKENRTLLERREVDLKKLMNELERVQSTFESVTRERDEANRFSKNLERQVEEIERCFHSDRGKLVEVAEETAEHVLELENSVKSLNEELARRKQENDRFKRELREKNELLEVCVNAANANNLEISQLRASLKEREAALISHEDEAKRLKLEAASLGSKNKTFGVIISEQEQAIRKDEQKIKSLKDSMQNLQDEQRRKIDELINTIEEEKSKVLRSFNENIALKKDLMVKQGEVERLSKCSDELAAVKAVLAERTAKDESMNEALRQNIDYVSKEMQLLRNEYVICQNHLEVERAKTQSLEYKLEEVQDTNYRLADRNNRDILDKRNRENQSDNLQVELRRLKESLARKEVERQLLADELRESKDQMRRSLADNTRKLHEVHRQGHAGDTMSQQNMIKLFLTSLELERLSQSKAAVTINLSNLTSTGASSNKKYKS